MISNKFNFMYDVEKILNENRILTWNQQFLPI